MSFEMIRYIDENAGLFTGVSDKIWAEPELSLKEFRAAGLYTGLLRSEGFEVTEGMAGIETAFCGSFGSGGPVIGILGEFDALDGMSQKAAVPYREPVTPGAPGHGCGHNMLGAGSLAAAFAVKKWLEANRVPGTVRYYGCPGEEGGAAKAFMAGDGAWKELDAAITWHPSDVNEVPTGTNNSCIQVLYKFHGVSSHAASCPEEGRSALDAVTLMNVGAQFLREHMSGDCRLHYALTDGGGLSPNVVQAEAAVLYMVRANKVRDSAALQKRLDKIAEGAALMTETECERVFIDGCSELVPNFALEKLLYRNFERIGVPDFSEQERELASGLRATYGISSVPGTAAKFDRDVERTVIEKTGGLKSALCDFILPEYHGTGFSAGSTDVGDVSWLTPAAQVHVACFPFGAPGHSWQNVSSGGSGIGRRGLITAAKVLALTAAELMTDPKALADIRAEFEKRTSDGYVCPIEPGEKPKTI